MEPKIHKGRFVSSSGLQKIVGSANSSYELIIVDNNGCPITSLIEWYRLRKQPGPNRTRRTYLGMLLPYFGYLLKEGLAWNAEPERLQSYIYTFLVWRVGCNVTPDKHLDGYFVQTTGDTPLSKSGLGVLLAALRDFYETMHEAGYYPHLNPMTSELLSRLERERRRQIANGGAPDVAGIRGETWQESRKHSTAAFRQIKRDPWTPDDATALSSQEISSEILDRLLKMTKGAKHQRIQVILLLLRHTGARLHEILGLTARGLREGQRRLRKDPHLCQALVVNKGGGGREEKMVYFDQGVEDALLRYIGTERARYDRLGRKRLEDLDDQDPIFLTQRRHGDSSDAFRYHWRKLIRINAQEGPQWPLHFTPHAIRHLHATQNLAFFKAEANGNDEKLRDDKEGYRQVMLWSYETMLAYDRADKKSGALQHWGEWETRLRQSTNNLSAGAISAVKGQLQRGKLPQMVEELPADQEDLKFWEE